MQISVVLCTKNRLNEICRFIKSLYNQTVLPNQFVVVDSSDIPLIKDSSFNELFNSKSDTMDLIYVTSEPGLTKQRNIGVKKTKGDVVYFFDDDIILDNDFIEIMNNTFEKYPEYMGGMGTFKGISKLSFKNKLLDIYDNLFLLNVSNSDGKFRLSGLAKNPHGKKNFMKVQFLGGGLTGYRRCIFDEFCFDENLTGYSYMEDMDFSRRVSYKYKLFYNPEAKLEHRHGEGGRGTLEEKSKMFMVNHRYFFLKNFYFINKFLIIFHLWSILGLIVNSVIFGPKERFDGYLKGLKEFQERKTEFKKNIFVKVEHM